MTYEQARKLPKGGATKMNNENLLALTCEIIGRRHSLRPVTIYDWAIKHSVPIVKQPYILDKIEVNTELWSDLMNDEFIETKKLFN